MQTQRIFRATAVSALFCLMTLPAMAGQKQIETSWEQLAGRILGKTITVNLPDGGVVQGDAIAVSARSLDMNVTRTSAPLTVPRGRASLLRSMVHEVRVAENAGSTARTIGTIIGVVSGVGVGAWSSAHLAYGLNSEPAIVGTFIGITSATTTTGYLAGRSMDRRVTVIRIVEPAVAQP